MTAEPSRTVLDHPDDGRGAVPHNESAALSTVENLEAVPIPSLSGVLAPTNTLLGNPGSDRHPPLEAAPGSYVCDCVPAGRR